MWRWFARRDRRLDPEAYPAGPVRSLAAASPPPFRTPVSEVEFLAVDLETTGLDPRRDHVLAVGWLPVTARQVVLAGAQQVLVRPPSGIHVGGSATVHRITDDAVAAAPTLGDVLPDLLAALEARVLLAHHAPIELGFLKRAAREAYGARLPLTAVDTMALQHQLVLGQQAEIRSGSLRLNEARQHFGLPRYPAHRALIDAVATGELLLAQIAELEHRLGREPVLSDLSPTRRR
jgi:DNA polymerase-3 subunit epsilon